MDSEMIEKIQDTVIMAGQDLEDAARKFAKKARLLRKIRTREAYLDELYKELGKEYYTTHRDEKNDTFEEIDRLIEELKQLRQEPSTVQQTK